jgi:hypothetical protein
MESPPFFAALRILEASNGPNQPNVLSHSIFRSFGRSAIRSAHFEGGAACETINLIGNATILAMQHPAGGFSLPHDHVRNVTRCKNMRRTPVL